MSGISFIGGGGGSGGPPSGAAGGDLGGTFPNPTVVQSSATPFRVLNDERIDGHASFGASSSTSDTITSRALFKPSAVAENAITIKRPDALWGVGQAYGFGQAIEFLRDAAVASDIGFTGVNPDDLVAGRMDRNANVGITGGLHVATGLRQSAGFTANYATFIQPSIDTIHVQLQSIAGAVQPFIKAIDSASVTKFQVAPSGNATFGMVSSKGLVIGDVGVSGTGGFGVAHTDRVSATDYALLQFSSGDTRVNAKLGQAIYLHTNGSQFSGAFITDTQTGIFGELRHIGSVSNKIGFYNVTPASRPAAYTQTYATATRTHSNPTGVSLTSFGVSADQTLVDVTTATVADPVKINANFDDVAKQINALIVDVANTKQVLNSSIDDDQLVGLKQ